MRPGDTVDDTDDRSAARPPAIPGVLAFLKGPPHVLPLPLASGRLVFGRDAMPAAVADERLSRKHLEIVFDGRAWTVRDLGSRNGTFVDGAEVHDAVVRADVRVVRAGDTLLVPFADLADGVSSPASLDGGPIVGMALRRALDAVARAADGSRTLLVRGESGTGKELAAHAFHERGRAAGGPFVAVNCATIPEGLAESLLFGARKGAFSGATADVTGYVPAADRGVLFLDEVGELDLRVQAKLLRVLENHEVTPLGLASPRKVDVRVCAATHRDLRTAVADGRFRADLYYRLASPEVMLPPLRERRDEIPLHVADELAQVGGGAPLSAHPKLVEACMLRPWPGNVRELRREVRSAAARAQAEGSSRVRVEHLAPTAGMVVTGQGSAPPPPLGAPSSIPPPSPRSEISRETIEQALAEHGTVAAAARSVNLHRTQFYREMERHGIDRKKKEP